MINNLIEKLKEYKDFQRKIQNLKEEVRQTYKAEIEKAYTAVGKYEFHQPDNPAIDIFISGPNLFVGVHWTNRGCCGGSDDSYDFDFPFEYVTDQSKLDQFVEAQENKLKEKKQKSLQEEKRHLEKQIEELQRQLNGTSNER